MTVSGPLDWSAGRVVVEVEGGVTVYPARAAGDRWRAVWYEGGRRRQCQAVTEAGLAAKLEKITAAARRRTRRAWNARART